MTRTLLVALPLVCLTALTGCDDSPPPAGSSDGGKDTGQDSVSQDSVSQDTVKTDTAKTDTAKTDLALADQAVDAAALEATTPDGPVADAPTDAECFGDATQPCYAGPAGTQGVGQCKAGTRVCGGGAWGGCVGQVGPASEICDNMDNDCDGQTDETLTQSCYTGTAGTQGVGLCKAGSKTCALGVWGSCTGEVVPVTEICDDKDNDCDGKKDETWPDTDKDGKHDCLDDDDDNDGVKDTVDLSPLDPKTFNKPVVGGTATDGGPANGTGDNKLTQFAVLKGYYQTVFASSGSLGSNKVQNVTISMGTLPQGTKVERAWIYRNTYDSTSTYLGSWKANSVALEKVIIHQTTSGSPFQVARADATAHVQPLLLAALKANKSSFDIPVVSTPGTSSGGTGVIVIFTHPTLPLRQIVITDGGFSDNSNPKGGQAWSVSKFKVGAGTVWARYSVHGGGDNPGNTAINCTVKGDKGSVVVPDVCDLGQKSCCGVVKTKDASAIFKPAATSATVTCSPAKGAYYGIMFGVLEVSADKT